MKKDMPVKGYQVGDTPTIEVFADGPTSPGGVRNTFVYGHHLNDYTFQLAGELNFQQGHPAKVGVNGLTLEAVLAICLQRLNAFQKGPYPSAYNAAAIMHIERGMEALKDRQREIQGFDIVNAAAWQKSLKVAVVDLETLAVFPETPRPVIASIGCQVVDVATGELTHSFYVPINHGQIGRESDPDTLAFWNTQKTESPAAWDELFSPDVKRVPLTDALVSFADFLQLVYGDEERRQVMGNGPEFDNAILGDAYYQAGIALPWSHKGNQSLRTAVMLSKQLLGVDFRYQIPFEGARHHALHDARHEAQVLAETCKVMAQCMGKPTPEDK